jgi:hypothetical protein
LAPKSDCAVGANGHVEATTGTTAAVGEPGEADPILAEGDAGATAADAATGRGDWLFNIVPKSVPETGLRVLTGRSDLRRKAGAVYAGRIAVLNVGMT